MLFFFFDIFLFDILSNIILSNIIMIINSSNIIIKLILFTFGAKIKKKNIYIMKYL